MRLGGILSFVLILAGSAAITGGAYVWDSARAARFEEQRALLWARQTASQVEAMALTARQRGEEDPVGWAAGYLTQGVEPRMIRVAKMEGNPGRAYEDHRYNSKSRLLDYTKVFWPESGSGIRVLVQQDYAGFLGTRTRITNDTALLGVFCLTFVLLYAFWTVVTRGRSANTDDLGFRNRVLDWLVESRDALTQLGVHIREMVREARNLAVASGQSRASLNGLRDRIHGGIRELRGGRDALKEVEKAAVRAEVLALNLIIQSANPGEGIRSAEAMADELHQTTLKIRELSKKAESAMGNVEVQVEPWATDADLAFHSYDSVFKAAEKMDTHIRKTTESVLSQARMIKGLNLELESYAPPSSRVVPLQKPVQKSPPKTSSKTKPPQKRKRAASA